MSAAHSTSVGTGATHLDKSRAGTVKMLGGALAVLGIGLSIAGAAADSHRFAFSYLTGFMFVLTLALGGLFFILIQHVTRAGWSPAPRRQAEWLASLLPVCALLFLPVVFFSHDLYHHWMGEQAAQDEILVGKSAYLNPTFFYIRAVIYFVVWSALGWYFTRLSRQQDESGDPEITNRMQAAAPVAILLTALTLTFAAFDWLMSLDPHWFSTIFGVYIFSGAFVGALAVMALITIALRSSGLAGAELTVEHQHDIGKLLFGFTVFWAYIAFSQFFLIWYANIPEETLWYGQRWEGGWKTLSYMLIFGHFWIPLVLLLSRHAKRSKLVLGIGATLLLAMHYVDMYWLVMPTLDLHDTNFTWYDLAGLLGPVGVMAGWLGLRASRDAIYPLRDPRLPEAVQLVNL